MNDPVAAIDLGTNTFHLLIAKKDGAGYRELVRRVDPVKLGEGGITKGIIADAPFERGISMLKTYASVCKVYQVKKIRAIATSAIRSAGNGQDFAGQVREATGISIEIVDGDEEARLIYRGVRSSGCLTSQPALIMDIGGGSIEFILCTTAGLTWKRSFEIGAARLMGRFHQTDPMPATAINALHVFLSAQLSPLFAYLKEHPVHHLVGSSGAFETFAEMTGPVPVTTEAINFHFQLEQLLKTLNWLKTSTHSQRKEHQQIIPLRVDMVVSAALVSEFMIRKLDIREVMMTRYSLKEGVMDEMIS